MPRYLPEEEELTPTLKRYFKEARFNFQHAIRSMRQVVALRHALFVYRALKWGWLTPNKIRALFNYRTDLAIKRQVEIVEELLSEEDKKEWLKQDHLEPDEEELLEREEDI